MNFTKMQGLGNDYLYVFDEAPENIRELCVKLSDRHFGAGADGMIYISHSQTADFKMRIFNADGSEAMMCGNGIRCVGKYVYDKGYTDKTTLTIETRAGIKRLRLHLRGNKVRTVSVEMGAAEVGRESRLAANGRTVAYTPVNVGNPHAVVFTDEVEAAPLAELGPAVEKHPVFLGGVNVEFAAVIAENRIRMRVWERGSGVTMACGTGACAAAAAAVARGLCARNTPITVALDGGDLQITVSDTNEIVMNGPAEFVYEGEAAVC